MKYVVEVEGQQYEIDVRRHRVFVDGAPLEVDVRRIGDLPLYSLLIDNESVEVTVEEEAPFQYSVMLGGELYSVVTSPAGGGALAKRTRPAVTDNAIRAPMPGLVASVPITVGQEVTAGQVLVVLESMKMENPLVAPRDALVAQLHVEQGMSVDKNQLLVTLDLKVETG